MSEKGFVMAESMGFWVRIFIPSGEPEGLGRNVRLSLPPKGGRPVLVHPAPDEKYRPTSHSKFSLC